MSAYMSAYMEFQTLFPFFDFRVLGLLGFFNHCWWGLFYGQLYFHTLLSIYRNESKIETNLPLFGHCPRKNNKFHLIIFHNGLYLFKTLNPK